MGFGNKNTGSKVLHDEYSLHGSSAAVRLTARLVLLCLMSASFVLIFCDIYNFQGNKLIPAVIAADRDGLTSIIHIFQS